MNANTVIPELWGSMLHLYETPGVEKACVCFQDACDIDVLLFLTAAVLAQSGMRLTPELAGTLVADTREWRCEVVVPLRALRRRWRGRSAVDALRERVKMLELDAERCQVDMLQSALQSASPLPRSAPGTRLLLDNCAELRRGTAAGAACDVAQAAFCSSVAAVLWPAARATNPG